jgi:hypothetical protein
MTTQCGHRRLHRRAISCASSLSRSATRSTWPIAKHLPLRRPVQGRPSAGPARPAPASNARLQPRADDAPSCTRRATTPTPAIPAVRLPAPPPRPRAHSRRTPDAGRGGRTVDTWTLRRPHRTPDARTRHWTPNAGRGRGQGDEGTAGIRTSGAHHAERPRDGAKVFLWTAPAALGSPCRLGALLSLDDFGSSVERTATLHPLWQVLEALREAVQSHGKRGLGVVAILMARSAW